MNDLFLEKERRVMLDSLLTLSFVSNANLQLFLQVVTGFCKRGNEIDDSGGRMTAVYVSL
jgi:hypothetical protein